MPGTHEEDVMEDLQSPEATTLLESDLHSIEPELEIFSACPDSGGLADRAYLRKVRDVARWSEIHGCRGMLIYSDN
ncbi:MAG TPA: hypothetical protein VE173_14245, partial [Longimicrobiales bacterium]|nr:hypothetical protein [Longimicrobiales bacterium]